ncbi:MAG: MOSC domain-containing protein [Dehalococcoidia bacterium]|nr:MOSC domain-containing protein [Dehalococcoidia bacterium]MDW8120337.1 MOSC domain-containing protein [Chloroflexota bacterium]
MPSGRVETICIATGPGQPMLPVERVRAIAGLGLEGDRYALGKGYYSSTPGTGRQLTLIEAEVLDALWQERGIRLLPTEHRRNITTRGIALAPLVGKRFRIGPVVCVGMRLCEPCAYLEGLTGKPILEPLVHKAGLRADILTTGIIQVGDPIEEIQE